MKVLLAPVTGLKGFLGIGYWRIQLLFLAVCLAFTGLYWLILGAVNPLQFLFFALVAGNSNTLLLKVMSPIYTSRPSPETGFCLSPFLFR